MGKGFWTCPYCGSNLDPGEKCDCGADGSGNADAGTGKTVPGSSARQERRVEKQKEGKMRILRMRLENFQGTASLDAEFGGKDAAVYGANGAGKTTLYNAFCWLVYGRASTDEKGFTPQTAGSHRLNHVAEMELALPGGRSASFRKDYHEVYKTKRGSAKSAFSGYTTDHFVDGVPVKESEYKARLQEATGCAGDGELARILTRGDYFLEEMKVQDRRKLLLDICGDIQDEDVIDAFPEELSGIRDILDGKGIAGYQKIAQAEKKKIDQEMKAIPNRIDEAEKAKPDIGGVGMEDLKRDLAAAERKKKDAEGRIAAAQGTAEPEIRARIAEAEAEKAEKAAAYARECAERDTGRSREAADARKALGDAEAALWENQRGAEALERKIMEMAASRETLLKEWMDAYKEAWTGDTVCPTCGRPFPEEKLEEFRKKFNLDKSRRLERIQARGAEVSEEKIGKMKEALASLREKGGALSVKAEDARKRHAELDAAAIPMRPFGETEEGKACDEKIQALRERLSDIGREAASARENERAEIARLDMVISGIREEMANVTFVKKQDERIRELSDRLESLAAGYEKLEHGLYLCERFSRRKAEMLDGKVNGKFETVRFRLFRELVESGRDGERVTVDDCEAMIPCGDLMVPFKSANNAARMNAGLEVMDMLAGYYGTELPLFIDGAESNTAIRHTKAQQIRLYVSERDKALRIEAAE